MKSEQNNYPKSKIICSYCKDEFTTDNPKKDGACQCKNIVCDVNEDYIRVMDCFDRGYRIEENGKITFKELAKEQPKEETQKEKNDNSRTN